MRRWRLYEAIGDVCLLIFMLRVGVFFFLRVEMLIGIVARIVEEEIEL